MAATATGTELATFAVEHGAAAQDAGELAELVAYLAGRPFERVLEIGVYKGGTMRLWRELGAAVVVGVDIGIRCWSCEHRLAHDGCPWRRIRAAGALVEGDSQDAATLERARELVAGPVDFLHIDGDHSLEAVARDFELYSPLVAPGGTIALHDVISYAGVRDFWAAELARRPGAFVSHRPPGGMGIGVLPA